MIFIQTHLSGYNFKTALYPPNISRSSECCVKVRARGHSDAEADGDTFTMKL